MSSMLQPLCKKIPFFCQLLLIKFPRLFVLNMLFEQRVAYIDLDHLKGYLALDDLRIIIEDVIDGPQHLILRQVDQILRNVLDHQCEFRSRYPISLQLQL